MASEKIDGWVNKICVCGKTYGIQALIMEAKPILCNRCGATLELKNGEGKCECCGTNYSARVIVEEIK